MNIFPEITPRKIPTTSRTGPPLFASGYDATARYPANPGRSVCEQELQQSRRHLVAEFSLDNEVKQEADWNRRAFEVHERFVRAALPVKEQDCGLAEGMAETFRDALVRPVAHGVTRKAKERKKLGERLRGRGLPWNFTRQGSAAGNP